MDDMTPRQLELFIEAAADLNFARTADRLGISQPAVSKQIRLLEETLRVQLFDRRPGRPVRLSEAGRSALDKARLALQAHEGLLGSRKTPNLRVVTVSTRHYLLDNYIKPNITAFEIAMRPAEIGLSVCDNVTTMLAELRDRNTDVGVYRGPALDIDGIRVKRICRAQCAIYAVPALAEQVTSSGYDLADAPWLLPPSHLSLSQWLSRTLAEAGIRPRSVVPSSAFPEVIRQQVVDGMGVALLYSGDMADAVAKGQVVPIRSNIGEAELLLLTRLDFPAAQTSALAHVLRSIVGTAEAGDGKQYDL